MLSSLHSAASVPSSVNSTSWVKSTSWVNSTRAAVPTWLNSSTGVHAFLTFDSGASASAISEYADKIDFVWGASESHVAAWRASRNPNVVLSKYMPFSRDMANNVTDEMLPWWQENYPSLVLYQCDRVTPAWECFAGEGCKHRNVPLDLTNPATLAYQMRVGVMPAAAAGYNAMALDNYNLRNVWKACGAFSGPGGAWTQLYDEADPDHDPQYTADVLDWTARATEQMHAAGMLVIPNFSSRDLSDSAVLAVGNLTDGMLAEAGFTMWNPVPNTSSLTTPPPMTSPSKFAEQVRFVRNLQRQGKGFFAINEWGAGPDYGLNPSGFPYNVSGPAGRPVRQFVVAAFLMVNGGACGIFLSCIQCYGAKNGGGLGNFSVWPEYSAPVGRPLEEPAMASASGVWSRRYSGGLTIVNPSNTTQEMVLPPGSWLDLYDQPIGTDTVQLPAASGLVLLSTARVLQSYRRG